MHIKGGMCFFIGINREEPFLFSNKRKGFSPQVAKGDEDEKTIRTINTKGNYITEAYLSSRDGIYEVLMKS